MQRKLAIQGHCDNMKSSLVYNVSVAKQFPTRILVRLNSTQGFWLFSTDVTQAHLQSDKELKRDLYVRTPKELNLD